MVPKRGRGAGDCREAARFFCETQEGQTDGVYELDGTALNRRALHPTAITATNAQASLGSRRGKCPCLRAEILGDTSSQRGQTVL